MAKNINKIIAGALVVVGGYFVYRYFTKKPLLPTKPKEEPITPPTGGGTVSANDKYPLKRGSRGKLVSSVQQWILKIDKNALPKFGADGIYGKETEAAVEKYLGKKTVDNDSDIDRLMLVYQQKTFPLMFPKQQPQPTFPNFPTFGFPK
jgi:hypothetical protein